MKAEQKEMVKNLIDSLKKEVNAVILVEGMRDYQALRRLGVTCPIEKVGGKRIFDLLVPERFQGKNIIILTDFDRRGCELFKRIKTELEVLGLNPNYYYWQQLKTLLKGNMTSIEELSHFSEDEAENGHL